MQIGAHVDAAALAALGVEAARLLCAGDLRTFADRFGYALAYGRDTTVAIQEDLTICLDQVGAASLVQPLEESVTVGRFEPNSTGLMNVVECAALANNGSKLLIQLVVTGNESARYLTLEGFNVAA